MEKDLKALRKGDAGTSSQPAQPGQLVAKSRDTTAHTFFLETDKSTSIAPHPSDEVINSAKARFLSISKIKTTATFDGKDFYTWSFELELLLQTAQIYHYFDYSYAKPVEDTEDARAQYYSESLMAYSVLLRNMTPAEQLGIRSYKESAAPSLEAWKHLVEVYQPKDLVTSSRLLQQLMETKMGHGEKTITYINRCRNTLDQITKHGSTISEEIFINIVFQGLGPEWKPCKALLRQRGIISEAALCAALLTEQQDMDSSKTSSVPRKERLAFYIDNREERRQPRRHYCKICKVFGHSTDRCKSRSNYCHPNSTHHNNWVGQQDARHSLSQHQAPRPPTQHQQQQQTQAPQAGVTRFVIANMATRRRPRAVSPDEEEELRGALIQPEEGWNNPFTENYYDDEDEQDWHQPMQLRESPPHDHQRFVPVGWKEDDDPAFHRRYKATLVTPQLALLIRNNNTHHNTWYLDSCCGQHMVGSVRYISNISCAPATYVTIANNEQLRANAQGIVMLQARDSNTHITFNYVLYVPDLRFNLLSAAQLSDSGVLLATNPYTRNLILTYAPSDTPVKSHKYLGRARSLNGVYVLDFDIPNCQASSYELMDLVPLNFPYMNVESWQHPDGRPWIRRNPHPHEINMHQPGPDSLCTTCFTPTASHTEEVERDYEAIQEAESAEAEPEGMTEMELALTTHCIFGTGDKNLGIRQQAAPAAETLRWVLEANTGTFDEEGRPRPYPRDVYRHINTAWKDPDTPEEPRVKEEEEKVKAEKKENLYQERIAAGWSPESARCGAWGDSDNDGATWGSATDASGTIQGCGTGGWGDAGGWGENDYADAPLTKEEEGPMLDIPQETKAEAEEHHARYLRTPRVRAEDDIWHQRLGHPSLQTFNNCLRAKVFQPGALLCPDSTEPLSTSHPTNCTICPTAALTHQAYPSLEPSTNRYKKLQKV
ncbi:unnamed protein product [Closterium sp. NIES-53]